MQSHDTITLTGSTEVADPAGEVTIPRELGPVRLLREIGRGGMGVVYLGRHQMLDRDVAVKFLLNAVAGPDDPGFARFLEGPRAAAAVQHPGLNVVYHADVVENVPYLVMQYIDGPTLGDLLRRTGPLGVPCTLALLDAVSEAIGELHDREIVHRDIKPANILLDREGRVVVTDFGLAIARPLGQRGPSSARLAGTPAYMASEMFAGDVSLRSDVYALGVMTFELLTGGLPFTGTLEEVREKHLHEPLPRDALQRSRLDPAMIEVLERATHKNPMFRYKTAEHLRKALQGSIATEELLQEGVAELHRLVSRALDTEPDATTTKAAETTPTTTYFDRLAEIAEEKRATREQTPEAAPESPARENRAEASPLPPGDQPVEVGSIPGSPSAEAARVPTLEIDLQCVKCEYNLRGHPAGGKCPECGESLASSLNPDRLMFADRTWLTRIARGHTVIHTTILATPVLLALPTLIDPVGMVDGLSTSWFLITLALLGVAIGISVAAMVGVFLSTTAELRGSGGSRKWTRRSAPRAFGLLWPSAVIAAVVLWASHAPVISIVVCVVLAIGAMLGTVISFLLHLATLADRIPDRQLVRSIRGLAVLAGAFVLLSIGAWSATVAYLRVDPVVAFFKLDRSGGTLVEWAGKIIVLGLLGIGVHLWLMMRAYRRAATQAIAANISYQTLFGDVPTAVALPTSENELPATRSPGAETGDTGGESTDVDEVPSADDIPCIHCGYNLRGLPEGGRCPECGTPIAQSSHGNLLSAADPAWVQRIFRGQALVYAGCVVLVTYWFLFSVTGSRGSLIVVHALGASSAVEAVSEAVLSAAAVLLLLLGAFTATALDPRLSLTEQPIALRRFVRWSIVALVALTVCSYLVPAVVKQLGVDAEVAALSSTVLLCASGLVFLSALVGICYYLAGLAMRIPDAKLATRTRSKVVRFVVCVGTHLLMVVWAVLTHGSGASAGGSVTLAGHRVVVSPIVIVLILVLTLVALGYIVSLMILMSTYRKAFRKCLLEARTHATAQEEPICPDSTW